MHQNLILNEIDQSFEEFYLSIYKALFYAAMNNFSYLFPTQGSSDLQALYFAVFFMK